MDSNPPLFKTLKLAVKPTLAKKAVINKFCNVVSNVIVAILVSFNISITIAKTSPPTTGAGIQYFDRNFILVLRNFPK